jgi:hypothetical protein
MGMKEWALSKGVTLYALVSTAQVQLLKSMMPFETSYDGSDPVENLVEHNWCSKSQMLQVS